MYSLKWNDLHQLPYTSTIFLITSLDPLAQIVKQVLTTYVHYCENLIPDTVGHPKGMHHPRPPGKHVQTFDLPTQSKYLAISLSRPLFTE